MMRPAGEMKNVNGSTRPRSSTREKDGRRTWGATLSGGRYVFPELEEEQRSRSDWHGWSQQRAEAKQEDDA